MSPRHLDCEIRDLIPLWVGISFDDLRADLKKKSQGISKGCRERDERYRVVQRETPFCQQSWLPSTDRPGSSYLRHLQRPVWLSGRRRHPLECKTSSKIFIYFIFKGGLVCIKTEKLVKWLTLRHILGSVDLKLQGGRSHCDTSRHQQVALYVVLAFARFSPLHLDKCLKRTSTALFFPFYSN